MVDSIKSLGSVPNIVTGKTSVEAARQDETKKSVRVTEDRVDISVRALNLQEAEKTARETATALKGSDYSLGLGPDFISQNQG